MIYIDLTDFLLYVRRKIRDKMTIIPTGIERVVMEYSINGIKTGKAQCVYYSSIKKKYLTIPDETVHNIYNSNLHAISYLKNIDIESLNALRIWARYRHNPVKAIFKTIKQLMVNLLVFRKYRFHKEYNFEPTHFTRNDILLFLCAPGILRKYNFLATLKTKYHIKMAMLIHDLMPLTLEHKYLPSRALTQETDFFIGKSINILDKYLVATNYWKGEIEKYFTKLGKKADVSLVKFGFGGKELPNIPSPVDGKFILTISTIQIRKNHIMLVKAWHKLLQKNLLDDFKLVIVGKWGWKVDELKTYIADNIELQKHIVILNNIDDASLASLYKNCLFTVFPSFAEGYGLPIVESFFYGKLCLASNTTAMPEVGKALAEYIDPYDMNNIADKIEKYITDKNTLNTKNKELENIKITSWEEASEFLYSQVLNKI